MTDLNTSTEATITDEAAIGFIPCYRLPFLSLFHADCMEIMKQYPDKYFDLAIVDPPYGINMDGTIGIGVGKNKGFTRKKEYVKKNWDNEIPTQEYFNEVFRVSKNQIIWGANYFTKQLPVIKNYIFWHKKGQSIDDKFNDGELAYVSLGRTRMIDIWWNGVGVINSKEIRTHPTQKPVKLYSWILQQYCKPNQLILDTHFGSGSITLAVDKANRLDKMNLHLTACEIDLDYVNASIKRISESIKQGTLSF